jgi:hypothetical protein
LSSQPYNVASQWFKATEGLGDFMGIRYGRIPHGSDEPEWLHVSHVECDGLGGFARLLRQRGATIDQLPTTKSHCRRIIGPLWKLWRNSRTAPPCATRNDWLRGLEPQSGPPKNVAWHVFSEQETKRLLDTCRSRQITVNSLLLKHLDTAVRPELNLGQALLPWMIPINLRHEKKADDDTTNQVSCVEPLIAPDDSVQAVHQQILRRLADGEHRANFLLMALGKFLSHDWKKLILARSRAKPAGNIGSFSNLGSWDPHKQIDTQDAWLFCPPVVTGQRLSAGCITFQNRLSLMLQAHLDHSGSPTVTKCWMERWVDQARGFYL